MPSTDVHTKSAATVSYYDFSHCKRMRVGIISDTHGHIDLDILTHLAGCELILHAGDIGSSSVLHRLRAICNNVIPVRGNNDCAAKWSSQEHEELTGISKLAEIKLPGGNIVLTHGDTFDPPAQRHENLRRHFTSSTAIVYGHSHLLVCDQGQKPWVLNPGAAGKSRTNGGASCLLVSINDMQWSVSEFRARKQ